MFRKGGSVSYGTGITSGLDDRENYQEGGFTLNPSMEGYMQGGTMDPRQITQQLTDVKELYDPDEPIAGGMDVRSIIEENQRKQLQKSQEPTTDLATQGIMQAALEDIAPTTGERVGRTLTGLAAAGRTDDPTKFKSWGQFLSEFGTTVAGLEEKDSDATKKFKLDVALERIKNLNKDEKDQLLRYASEYAQIEKVPPEQRTEEQKARMLFLRRYLEGVPRKGVDFQQRQLSLYDELRKPRSAGGAYGYSSSQASNIARVQIAIEQSGGKIKSANFGPKDGNYSDLPAGRYIDPDAGTIVLWDGKNKKQVWPS